MSRAKFKPPLEAKKEEFAYQKLLASHFLKLRRAIAQQLLEVSKQDSLIEYSPIRDSLISDNLRADKLQLLNYFALIQVAYNEFKVTNPEERLINRLRSFVDVLIGKTKEESIERFKQQLKKTAIDPFANEEYLRPIINNFLISNTALITKVEDEVRQQIADIVLIGLERGDDYADIAAVIRQLDPSLKNRAALIARDQMQKITSQFERKRHEQLGATSYRWRTRRDGRVRESHKEREGKKFDYQFPPEDGNPGEPINCRCWAEPVF